MPTFLSALMQNARRRRVRRQMLSLDDHLLRDIGLTRDDIRARLSTPLR